MSDEPELIDAARQGSAEAFTALVTTYQARIRGYLARWIRDPSTVDDLAQEVFLAAWKGLANFRSDAPFGVWLAGIARHQALTYIRSDSRRRQLRGDLIAETADAWRLKALEADSDRLGERLAEVERLKRCLEGLTAQQRSLVDAHYLAGRACVDIARERDQEAGTVRMALMRVRQTLRACVERGTADAMTGDPA
jgi:RNA polymerase sigma-70 factor, ECF subfamily